MHADAVAAVPFPASGTHHAHTGCFHVECPMPQGLELWLFGSWPYPKVDGQRVAFELGQTLGGYLRPAGVDSEEIQRRLEQAAVLSGLAVRWVELPFPSMHRWFEFRVEAVLVDELFRRLHAFIGSLALSGVVEEGGSIAEGIADE
jgi:hypothetical protein